MAALKVDILNNAGEKTGKKAELPAELFDVPLNVPLIHQVVVAQQAAARQGTHATKTRGMVSGGGRKPYRQKGTGNARQGSTRAPQFKGGGTVHGPQPRDYSQHTPKKMKAGALHSALSDRARKSHLHVIDQFFDGDTPSTKTALKTLQAVVDARSALVVFAREEANVVNAVRSLNNLPAAHVLWVDQLNTYDVINNEDVIFTVDSLAAFVNGKEESK